MAKSPDAFRTISEVADWLGIQAHVLRFWESKFTQVKPIKRAGGRRYYRPADMLLLGGIKKLLHDDGLTIKGVQKILREEGMGHVVDMSAPLDELTLSQLGDKETAAPKAKPATAIEVPEEEKGVVLSFDNAGAAKTEDTTPEAVEKKVEPKAAEPVETPEAVEKQADTKPEPEPEPEPENIPDPAPQVASSDEPEPAATKEDAPAPVAALPAFLRQPLAEQDTSAEKPDVPTKPEPTTASEPAKDPAPTTPAAKKPRVIDLPAFTAEADFPASPAALTSAFRVRKIAPQNVEKTATLLRQLTALRDQMAARRRNDAAPPAQD